MDDRTALVAPWVRGYDRAWLRFDVLAGLSSAAVVVSLLMLLYQLNHPPIVTLGRDPTFGLSGWSPSSTSPTPGG